MERLVIYTLVMFSIYLTAMSLGLNNENKRLIREIDAQSCRVSLIINGEYFFYVYPGTGLLEGGGFSTENHDPPIMVESMEFKLLQINR